MPTNQSSPWGGAKLRACSAAGSPTAPTSVGTHAKAVAPNKVPFGQTSLELTKEKDQAKSLPSNVASPASPLRQTTVAPSRFSAWESGDGIRTNVLSQSTTVPQQSDLIQILNKSQEAAVKQAGSSLAETSPPIPMKDCQLENNIQLLQTSHAGKGFGISPCQAAVGDAPLGVCHQDLFIKGQQNNHVKVSIHIPIGR